MAIESALIPLPSEVIMPFSGYLASIGRFDLALVILFGSIGNTLGSLVAYGLGYWGRDSVVRRFVRKYGRFILFTEKELDATERLMHRYNGAAVLVARFTPGIRTIISLPAGVSKLPLGRFVWMTFIGTLLWSALLAWIGYVLGNNWKSLEGIFRKFDAIIVIGIVLLLGTYVYRKLKD